MRTEELWIEDKLHWGAPVEIGIAFRRLLERDHLRVDHVRDRNAIVQQEQPFR
jgi:hypothetical protein